MYDHVEEDEEGQGTDAPLEGEPRQAPQHGPGLTYLVEFVVGGDAAPWAALGLRFFSDSCTIGTVRLRVDPTAVPGLRSVGLLDVVVTEIDGAPVHPADPPIGSGPDAHDLRPLAFDHVVLMTPDLSRTCDAVTAATGAPLKRIREAGPVRQGFFRLGEVILEVVQSPQVPEGPARWWGLVINVEDLDAACERLGPEVVSPPRAAVQPGRRIVGVRESLGHGVPLALMSR